MTLARAAAEYIGALRLEDAPSEVVERVKTCLLYTLCVTVAGHEPGDPVLQAAKAACAAPGRARLFITGEGRRAADAAFVNAVLSCARGQNDTHPRAVGHAGCIIVPAVLAVAEERASSSRAVLEALLAGYELLPKLAADAANEAVARGMRATSVFGPVIAAAAVSRLIGLAPQQTAHALSIATQFAGGTMQCWAEGTPEWRFQVGHSAQAGIQAALLAEAGATAAQQAFEGSAGYYKALFGRVPEVSFDGWDIGDTVFKPYPGCLINQAAVYMLHRMMRSARFAAGDVEAIVVSMSPRDARYPGVDQYGPFTQQTGAVMSLAFMVATLLQEGTLRASHFREHHGEHPVHAASRLVQLREDASMPAWSCALRVELKDGQVLEDRIPDQRCFAFGWSETTPLLRDLVQEWCLPEAGLRYQRLEDRVSSLDRHGSASELLDLCCAPA